MLALSLTVLFAAAAFVSVAVIAASVARGLALFHGYRRELAGLQQATGTLVAADFAALDAIAGDWKLQAVALRRPRPSFSAAGASRRAVRPAASPGLPGRLHAAA